MDNPASNWLIGFMFTGMLMSFGLIVAESELAERHFRLLALVMGLPMALLLALEGLLSPWATATEVVGIVAFAAGRPAWFG